MFACDNGSGNSNNNDDPPDTTPTFESQFYGKWGGPGGYIYTFSEDHTFTQQLPDGTYRAKGTWSAESPNKFTQTFTHSNPDWFPAAKADDLPEMETTEVQEGEVEWVSDDSFTFTLKTLDGATLGTPFTVMEFVRAE